MPAPFFSVMVPVHDRRELVLRALRSVVAQEDRDFELIVVDDASADGSADIVEAFLEQHDVRGKLVRCARNGGIPVARNIGLRHASGRIATFLDSDDAWHPQYLSLLRSAFAARSRPLFAFTDYFSHGPRYSGPVRQFRPRPTGFDPIEVMITEPFIHTMSCFAAPVAEIAAVGAFNERLSRFSDLDLYVRLMIGVGRGRGRGRRLAWQESGFVAIPQVAVLKTIHLQNRVGLQEYEDHWEAGKNAFLDEVFAHPAMSDRLDRRERYADSLAEGKRRFFANFQ